MKNRFFLRSLPAIVLLSGIIAMGLSSCDSGQKSKTNTDDLDTEAETLSQDGADTIYFGYGSEYSGPEPVGGESPTTGTIHTVTNLASNSAMQGDGTPIVSVADRISLVIECRAGTGLVLRSVGNDPLTQSTQCEDGTEPYSLEKTPWEYPNPADSTVVSATISLDAPNEACKLGEMEITGGIIVVLAEAMPDPPGFALIKEVSAWKNGNPVPTKLVTPLGLSHSLK